MAQSCSLSFSYSHEVDYRYFTVSFVSKIVYVFSHHPPKGKEYLLQQVNPVGIPQGAQICLRICLLRQLNRLWLSLVWPALQQSSLFVTVLSGASLIVPSASPSSCSLVFHFPDHRQPSWAWPSRVELWPLCRAGTCSGVAGVPVFLPFFGSLWLQSPAGAAPLVHILLFSCTNL